MCHPQCITNPRFLTIIYRIVCACLNLAKTVLLVYLTGNESAECTFGDDLYKHTSETDSFYAWCKQGRFSTHKQQEDA